MKKMNNCLQCGKETKNKEFCSGQCRKSFNIGYAESNHRYPSRSFRGLRA